MTLPVNEADALRSTRGRTSRLLLSVVSLLLFTGSFHSNRWGVARQSWFDGFQRGTECHVLGRLVKSRQDGLFSASGLLGVGVSHFEKPSSPSPYALRFRRADLASGIHMRSEGEEWPVGDQIEQQYDAYRDGRSFEIYSPYLSQIGGQGMLLGALDAIPPLSPPAKLSLFYLLTALLSAAALTAIVLWFSAEFSTGLGAWVLATAVCSQWLAGFGRNLWWSLWAFYLPFVVLCRFETKGPARTRRYYATLAALSFGTVLVKCFTNGYEYITTTLVMMAIPCVYYWLRDGPGMSALIRTAFSLGLGSAAAIAASLAILIGQMTVLTGRATPALRHIGFSLAVRTQGAAADFPEAYGPGLTASHIGVLSTYLKGDYIDLKGRWPTLAGVLPRRVRYDHILVVFAAASLLLGGLSRGMSQEERRRHFALLTTTWFALLAPLSWLVIFKAHSYEHTHMNFVVWQMPFTFFGFAVCGAACTLLARRVRRGPR